MIDHEKKIIQVHIPKTGGTSVTRSLFGDDAIITHKTATRYDVKCWRKYFTFSFVRNPYTRVMSHYSYHVQGGYKGKLLIHHPDLKTLTFDEYIERFIVPRSPQNFKSQVEFITHKKAPNRKLDFVGRFESFSEDANDLLKRLGVDKEVPHLKKSKSYGASTGSLYTSKGKKLVEQAYADEFETLGYKKQSQVSFYIRKLF
jgi:chondroitin 4-sulfotransferase 11